MQRTEALEQKQDQNEESQESQVLPSTAIVKGIPQTRMHIHTRMYPLPGSGVPIPRKVPRFHSLVLRYRRAYYCVWSDSIISGGCGSGQARRLVQPPARTRLPNTLSHPGNRITHPPQTNFSRLIFSATGRVKNKRRAMDASAEKISSR